MHTHSFLEKLLKHVAHCHARTASDFQDSSSQRSIIIICRALFSIGVALLVAGSCLAGQYTTPNLPSIGVKLVKAGYIVVTVIFAALLGFEAYFWVNRTKLGSSGLLVSWAPPKASVSSYPRH